MAMPLKDLNTLPSLLPTPQFNCHIITCGKAEGLRRVYGNRTNVIGVGLEAGDLLGSIVVDNAQLEIVRPSDNPVLPRDEATSSNRDIGQFKGLDGGSCFVGPDVNVAAVKRGKDPWFFGLNQHKQFSVIC